MKKSRLLFFAIIILSLLSLSIFILSKKNNQNNDNITVKSNELKANSEKLVDYDSNVIKFGKDVFFIDEIQNLLIKYNSEADETMIVHDFKDSSYGKKFFIRNDRLIFSFGGNTYFSDLNGNNLSKICNGEIVFINNDVYLYIAHKDMQDELYITSYDNKTFKQTLKINNSLAKGTTINYLKSYKDEVYFTSKSLDNIITLFEINLKDSNIFVINKRNSDSSVQGKELVYSNVIKTDKSYYYIVDKIAKTTNEDSYVSSDLYLASRQDYYSELNAENLGKFLLYDNNKKLIIYQKYDEEKNLFVWKSTLTNDEFDYRWQSLLYGDITSLFTINDETIYENGYEFVNIGKDISSYKIRNVVRLKNGLYIMLENDYSSELYFCKESGNSLKRIY